MIAVQRIKNWLNKPISIAPLVAYRILFGLLVVYGCLWSVYKDDITVRYTSPTFFFKYYGLEWLPYLGDTGIYVLYVLWLLAAIGITLGLFYRWCIWVFFFVFSYLHLLDATNYINHYYAISIFALFLALLPANASFSVDVYRNPSILKAQMPNWIIRVFQLQIAIIYTGAAIAKMYPDWIFESMPLKIWLLQRQDFPVIGFLFAYDWVHIAFSWIGLLFDLTIVYWLLWSRTRPFAYFVVLIFHVLTGMLLNIGLFPFLMIMTTPVFFSPSFFANLGLAQENKRLIDFHYLPRKALAVFFAGHFLIQVVLPFRHHFMYPCDAVWTEEGYRFSWWVMLVEKEGQATFYVKDRYSNRRWEVTNAEYLMPYQEKRMSVRPDLILQFAHHLAAHYSQKFNLDNPIVTADVYVAMNGRPSRRLVDPEVNLVNKHRGLFHYDWIFCYPE